jgi:uncharacterized phage protein gp47/JayE
MIDVGTPFSRSFESLIGSLQTSLELGVEQPATLDILYQASTGAYQIRGAGPVSGLAAQITGFIAGKPAVFNLNQHYRYAVGQLVWQPLDTSDPALKAGWFPDDNSRLTVGYFYRDLPSGITDFNAGSVAGTLVRAVSRELKLLYEQMDEAYRRAFIDYAQGPALDNVVALLNVSRNQALPAHGEVTFTLKKPPRIDVVIPLGTRVADARGRLFKVTAAGVVPAQLVETPTPAAAVLHAAQAIGSLVNVRVKGTTANLATKDTATGKPFGDDGKTVTLVSTPPATAALLLTYLAKVPTTTVPVIALDTGPEGNLGSGSLTVMPTPPRGLDGSVTNLEPLTGGQAAEADEALRERAKHALETAGNATLNAIRFAVLSIDGVDSVEVRDFSVDPIIPLGEVWVRFATGEADLQGRVEGAVDQTRSAGIKARVTQVSTVTISGTLCVIPDAIGAGTAAYAAYQQAVVDAVAALGIGEAVSPRKLGALVFRVAGLADIAEAQLDFQRLAAPLQPIAGDPFLISPDEQARPDAGAIEVVPLQALLPGNAKLAGDAALTCTLELRNDANAPVPMRHFQLALRATIRGKPAATPNQPLQQVDQVSGTALFSGAATASATFDAVSIPGLATLDAASLEVLIEAAAYPGMRGGATALVQA